MIQKYINHISFVLDASSSMSIFKKETILAFDRQIEHLKQRSIELDQETRVSIYVFSDSVKCLLYDQDVCRLPSIKDHYEPRGMTALIDAVYKSIEDLKKNPELYGDHSNLIIVQTDGENNINSHLAKKLKETINSLPENYTVAVLVPNQNGVHECKKFGFPVGNIQIWETSSRGLEEASKKINTVTSTFMTSRSKGLRSTKNLFQLDTAALNSSTVKSTLVELNPSDYSVYSVHKDKPIKDFVESWNPKETYRIGSGFYQLTKKEKVQGYKQVCLQDKLNGKVYAGAEARQLLGLPDHEVQVDPATNNKYDIFLQSTSTNRKLIAGTKFILMK